MTREESTPPSSADRWTRLEEIFDAALALDAAARSAYVDAACGEDHELRQEILRLLTADQRAGKDFLAPVAAVERPPAMAFGAGLVGRQLDRYQILALIGEGGSSRVYLAARADDAYQQRVAVKVLQTGAFGVDASDRFRRERQILAALDHPNIAKLLDGGTTPEGAPYLVMELVEGLPIDVYCDNHQLPVARRLELFIEVAHAVAYAHRNLVIHRDLKPSNVLVRADGRSVLLDFGIAKPVNPELLGDVAPTRFDLLLLTPNYASPEQIRGAAITTASDVYSLGVVLYLLLARQLPYRSDGLSLQELVRTVCDDDPPPPSKVVGDPELARELRGDLDHIVAKAMAKSPERRYRGVEQLIEDIERYQNALPVFARDGGLAYRLAKGVRRHRWAVAAVTTVLLAGLAFATHTVHQSRQLARALAQAEGERARAETQRARAEAISGFLTGTLLAADPYLGVGKDTTVLEAIGRAEPTLRGAFAEQPEVEAEIRGILGETYYRLGDQAEAERQLRSSLELRQGDDDVDAALARAKTWTGLGKLLMQQSRFEEADQAYQRALEIRRQHLGATDFSTLNTLSNLAILRANQGRFAESDTLMAEAYDGYLLSDHPMAPRVAATILMNRASTLERMGRLEQAFDLTRRADKQLTAILGKDHLLVAVARSNLGLLHLASGHPQTAWKLLEEALDCRTRQLGAEHPEALETRMGLARTQLELGDARQASAEIDEVLRALHQASAPRQLIAMGLNIAAEIRLELDDLAGADAALTEGRTLLAEEGEVEDRLIAAQNVLAARVARQRGQLARAETLASEAALSRQPAPGEPASWDHALASEELARVLCAAGRHDEARELFAAVRAYFMRVLEPTAWRLLRLRCDEARCLKAAGRDDEAAAVLPEREVLAASPWAASLLAP